MDEDWGGLMDILREDPEIVIPRQRYHELTGIYLGFNMDQYATLDDYKARLRAKVAEAEKERGLAPGHPVDATTPE